MRKTLKEIGRETNEAAIREWQERAADLKHRLGDTAVREIEWAERNIRNLIERRERDGF
jgi:hypothetical protein